MGVERTTIRRRMLIGLTLIVVIGVSAAIGLLIANGPECLRYFAGRH